MSYCQQSVDLAIRTETKSVSVQHAQQLIHGERHDPEHQVAQHLRVTAHPYVASTEFVLEPAVDPLDGRALPVAQRLGVLVADDALRLCLGEQCLLARGITAGIVSSMIAR